MKKKQIFLAAVLFLCVLLVIPSGKSLAATSIRIKSVSTIYQNSTKVTGKATPGYILKLRLNGRVYRTRSQTDGTYTFKNVRRSNIGDKGTITIYNKKSQAVQKKNVIVKGNLAFKVTGYDTLNHVVKGNGMAGKRVRVKIGTKTYTTVVASDGTWKKTIPAVKSTKTSVKVSQQKTGTTYSTAKSVTIKKSAFNTAYIKKGATYYSSGYRKSPKTSWASFKVKEVIGSKIYFSFTVCQIKNGKANAQTLSGVGTVKGKRTMYFEYMKGLNATFTWQNSRTVKVVGNDSLFGHGRVTEIMTAK